MGTLGTNEPLQPVSKDLYPLLSEIESPADLRKLPVKDLPKVAKEIRSLIIKTLSENPGHFGSSMGAVDFIIALHYVFDTPYDRLVWDVGHQAYAHKILTGRRDLFHTNRKFNGLSGFPNPAESDYDTFSAGHASNSVSAALGMAVASEIKGEKKKRNVVAVIGDASISGGLAFEGLNNASNTPNDLLIVLNDNEMSIDSNIGALHNCLRRIHSSKSYNKLRFKIYKLLKRLHLVTERGKGFIMRFNNSLKSLLFKQHNIFEGLNIRYFGPYDGHDIEQLVKVLNDIKDIKGPRILHLKTKKGKGFKTAEKNPAAWHAPGKFNPESGEILSPSTESHPPKFQDVFGETITELAEKNDKIIGITAAMSSGTSISTMRDKFPDRVFDVGISEGHAVTFAGGLAKEGLRPYVAIYSSFLQRAYDNIIHDVAIQKLPVVFCIDRAGIVGEDGVTHHGLYDLSYMSEVPGMIVSSPRNEKWLRNLLFTSQTDILDSPMSIRYPRGSGKITDWRTPMEAVGIGKGEKLQDGKDITVISLGPIANEVTEAIKAVEDKGISVAHYDAVFLKPFDEGIIDMIVEADTPVVTVEDASLRGGLYTTVVELLHTKGFSKPVIPIGIDPEEFVSHGSVKELYEKMGMDAGSIAEILIKNVAG